MEPDQRAAPSSAPSFEGHQPRDCGEHRTVGPHRAYCLDCSEWCYPDSEMGCKGCRIPILEAARDSRYSFTRDQLIDALTHMEATVPVDGRKTVLLNAESMADAIIEGLEDGSDGSASA